MKHAGFTLIELLIVFTLIAFLSLGAVAAFVSFGNQQSLQSAAGDIKNMLDQAKSQTLNQIDNCPAGQQFGGYKVLICCVGGGNCPTCKSSSNFEMDMICNSTSSLVSSKNLPPGVSIDGVNTSSRSYLFTPVTGAIVGAGQVTVQREGKRKTVVVNSTGVIQ